MGRSVSLPLGNVSVPFSVPAANELPHTMAGRDFLHLFQCLDVNNVIMLWALLLSEQKVVLQSKTPHVLTMAAETLCAILFPFTWQHVYIPILPARLLDILQAPVPFLMGIDEEVLASSVNLIPNEVVVDLDQNARATATRSHAPPRHHPPRPPPTAPPPQVRRRHRREDAPAAAAVPQAVQGGGFCRRLNTDDGMSPRSPRPSRWRRRPTTTPAPPTPPARRDVRRGGEGAISKIKAASSGSSSR